MQSNIFLFFILILCLVSCSMSDVMMFGPSTPVAIQFGEEADGFNCSLSLCSSWCNLPLMIPNPPFVMTFLFSDVLNFQENVAQLPPWTTTTNTSIFAWGPQEYSSVIDIANQINNTLVLFFGQLLNIASTANFTAELYLYEASVLLNQVQNQSTPVENIQQQWNLIQTQLNATVQSMNNTLYNLLSELNEMTAAISKDLVGLDAFYQACLPNGYFEQDYNDTLSLQEQAKTNLSNCGSNKTCIYYYHNLLRELIEDENIVLQQLSVCKLMIYDVQLALNFTSPVSILLTHMFYFYPAIFAYIVVPLDEGYWKMLQNIDVFAAPIVLKMFSIVARNNWQELYPYLETIVSSACQSFLNFA